MPEHYGLIAMITAISGFGRILMNFGLGSAIIYNDEVTKKQLYSIFWFNTAIGIILTLLLYFGSGSMAKFYGNNDIILPAKIISFTFLLNSMAIVTKSLLMKEMNIRSIAIISFLKSVLAGSIGIVLAYLKPDYFALVYMNLSTAGLNLIFLMLFHPFKPKLYFNLVEIRKFVVHGLHLFASSSLSYWAKI